MTSLYKPIKLILEFYYISNDQSNFWNIKYNFANFLPLLGFE